MMKYFISMPLFESLLPIKNVCTTYYLHTLAKLFQVLLREFSLTRPKISFYCSLAGINKQLEKEEV